MRPARLSSLMAVAAILWLALVVSLYYVYHKPFSPDLALNLARGSWQLGVAFAILAVCGGLGMRLLPDWSMSRLARMSLASAFGLGPAAILILALGMTAGFFPLWAWALLALPGIALRREVAAWLRAWGELPRLWQGSGRLGGLLSLGVGLVLLVALVRALAPPVMYDALGYHLSLPKAYLHAGRIAYIPETIYWGMPQLGEMLYTWAMALGGGETAPLVGWMAGVLALVGILDSVGERFGARAGWIAVAALLSGYVFASSLSWGYIDWFGLYFGWAFLALLEIWLATKERRALLWLGAFAGFALGTKYTAGVLVLAGMAAIAWFSRRELRRREWIASLLWFGLAAMLASLPWWVKNALATGNPFYPFFFPAGAMDAFRLDLYQNRAAWGGWADFFFLPLRATITGWELDGGYSASIGPLLLGLGALAVPAWFSAAGEQKRSIAVAGCVAVAGLVVWATAGRMRELLMQSRVYFAIFPAFAALAGAGYQYLTRVSLPGVRLERVAGSLVVMVLAFTTYQVGADTLQQGAFQALFGLRDRQGYLDDNLGWHAPAMRLLEELPPESRVVMLWEARDYYCTPRCAPDDLLDRWRHGLKLYGGSGALLQSWRQAQATHLLYNKMHADVLRRADTRYQAEEWHALDELLAGLPPPTPVGEAYYLYPLRP